MNITDKQKIKLLAILGWKYYGPDEPNLGDTPLPFWSNTCGAGYIYAVCLPSLSDLNVLHNLEEKLTEEQRKRYEFNLRCAVNHIWHATASQRLAALCLTLNITDETLTLEDGK